MSRLYIIILNTNRRDDTLECLRSLRANSYESKTIVVLDNASTDGSVEAIRAGYPEAQIVGLTKNLGYAGNNNVGIDLALKQGADWILVLNEDTVLSPDCLERMIEYGERNENIGIVGPMVYHFDEPQVIQSAGGVLGDRWDAIHLSANETDVGQYLQPHAVEWISGCAIMLRRKLIEQIGALDERFYYYWEEVEWCVRASKAGWRIAHVPSAKLWHKGVQRNYRPKPSVGYYSARNRFLMMSKHRAPIATRAMAWFQWLRTVTSYSVRPKWRDKRDHRDAMLRGAIDYLRGRWGAMPS
jgi:hypothetical protein